MPRIIIDTNVLVSALIQRSYPFLVVDYVFVSKDVTLCLSDALFAEYYEVLNRPKFSRFPDFLIHAQALLVKLEQIATKFTPTSKVSIIKDADDNRLLELAEASKAHFLITGNTNDFTMKQYNTTKIVTPKEFVDYIGLI